MMRAAPKNSRSSDDTLGYSARRRRTLSWCGILIIALIFTMGAGVIAGPVDISSSDSIRIISHHLFGTNLSSTTEITQDAIVWDIRVPRVLLGAAVGAGLALAGVILQALVRNMLADPYVLGVNSGASVGAAAAVLFGAGAGFGDYALQGSAFFGALSAIGTYTEDLYSLIIMVANELRRRFRGQGPLELRKY